MWTIFNYPIRSVCARQSSDCEPIPVLFLLWWLTRLLNFLQSRSPHDQTCRTKTVFTEMLYARLWGRISVNKLTPEALHWMVSTLLEAKESLWVKVFSFVLAESTSAVLRSNSFWNLLRKNCNKYHWGNTEMKINLYQIKVTSAQLLSGSWFQPLLSGSVTSAQHFLSQLLLNLPSVSSLITTYF